MPGFLSELKSLSHSIRRVRTTIETVTGASRGGFDIPQGWDDRAREKDAIVSSSTVLFPAVGREFLDLFLLQCLLCSAYCSWRCFAIINLFNFFFPSSLVFEF